MHINKEYSYFPTKLSNNKWIWLKTYYTVCDFNLFVDGHRWEDVYFKSEQRIKCEKYIRKINEVFILPK